MKEKHKHKEQEPIFSEAELKEGLTEEQKKEKGFKISESIIYKIFVKTAYRLLHKPLTIFKILKKAVERLQMYDSVQEFTEDVKERFALIIRMIQAYVQGAYTGISKLNAALSLAAILYFISPIDIIPDFLIVGFIDDLAILTWVYNNFQEEITLFLEWEEAQKVRINLM